MFPVRYLCWLVVFANPCCSESFEAYINHVTAPLPPAPSPPPLSPPPPPCSPVQGAPAFRGTLQRPQLWHDLCVVYHQHRSIRNSYLWSMSQADYAEDKANRVCCAMLCML